jgi:DNA-binding NtrC family response regulator
MAKQREPQQISEGDRRTRLLVVDDEVFPRRALSRYLRSRGYEVMEASTGEEALELVNASAPSVVILDLVMPGMGGLETLRSMRRLGVETPVIILTAIHDIDSAMEATRLGATDYLTKPYEPQSVVEAVDRCLSERDRREQMLRGSGPASTTKYGGLIGNSPPMLAVIELLRTLEGIAPPTVLISGESGTGKDVVARAIHSMGARSRHPFVEVDCTAIPENLMESTLFGHERGAFTGAARQHRGLFEIASGGIVFLDEIGEMQPGAQAKLLRALENRRFKRVGGTADIEFDACVIAATNRDLKKEVIDGRFREDLYYRLAVIPVSVPPLRERSMDIPLLIRHFATRYAGQFDRPFEDFADEAIVAMCEYQWPGNVRELRNVAERLIIFASAPVIEVGDLPAEIRFARRVDGGHLGVGATFVLPEEGIDLEVVERSLIEQALHRTDFNQSQAARLVGLTRFGIRHRMKKYGMLG